MARGDVRVFRRCLESQLDRFDFNVAHLEHIPSLSEAVALIDLNQPMDQITSIEPSVTVKRASKWLAGVAELLAAKNAAYGDSAANPMRVFSKASPTEQLLVRIDDKLSRIARGKGLLATDEDVLRDLVGYLALLAVALKE
jgi:hypothetical protein